MHLVPVPINVRCYSNSNPIVRRSEVTLRAIIGSRCPHSYAANSSSSAFASFRSRVSNPSVNQP